MKLPDDIREATVVHVEPSDVIWLRVARRIEDEVAEDIKQRAKEIWPNNQTVVAYAVDISVVRAVSTHPGPPDPELEQEC